MLGSFPQVPSRLGPRQGGAAGRTFAPGATEGFARLLCVVEVERVNVANDACLSVWTEWLCLPHTLPPLLTILPQPCLTVSPSFLCSSSMANERSVASHNGAQCPPLPCLTSLYLHLAFASRKQQVTGLHAALWSIQVLQSWRLNHK